MTALQHLERIIAAGNAMAEEMRELAKDAIAAGGDPSDGDAYTRLANAWRDALANEEDGASDHP